MSIAVRDPVVVDPAQRLDLRLLGPAGAAWVACAVGLAAPMDVLGPGVALLTVSSLGLLVSGRRMRAVPVAVPLTMVVVALVLMALVLQRDLRSVGTIHGLAEQGAAVTVEASVASDPQLLAANGVRRTALVMVRLQVKQVVGRGARSSVDAPVLAFAQPSWSSLRWGERVEVRGRLAPAQAGDDIVATLSGKGTPLVLAPPGVVHRAADRLRQGLQVAVGGAPSDGAGLLPGLVLGDTSRLDPTLQDAMRSSGLTHLVAVSGSNVAIVCGAVLMLARRLGLPRRLRAPATALALVGFVIVARPEPSVLRAAVMGGIGLIGLASARRSAGLPPLAAAVVVLLVVDPWLARSYGFALSVLATLGLLLFARPWAVSLSRVLTRPIALALAIPLAAQAACGPIIVLLQGSVSLVSVPANLVVAPLVAPATLAGVGAAILSVIWPWGAHLIGYAGALAAEGIAIVARIATRAPSLPWPGGARGAVALAVLTAIVIVGAAPCARACARHPWAAAGLAPVLVAGIMPGPGSGWPPPGWVMVMCDVGQGDGLVLSIAPGRAIVVDTGPDPALMDRCLRGLGVRTVDLLVLTHDHSDHVEGIPGVLHGRRVRMVLRNGLDDPPQEAARIRRWTAAAHVPVEIVHVGDTGADAGLTWQALWPAEFIQEGSVPNNASIVLLVHSGGLRLLLLGDVETPAARQVAIALQRIPGGPHADVLKVAHHGSALQDPGLVQEVDAPLALISVGAGNPYGHPARSTVDLLRGTGASVHRTDLDGDIAVVKVRDGPATVTHHR